MIGRKMDRSQVTIIIPHLGGTKESEYAFDQCIMSLEETEPDIARVTVRNGEKCDQHRSHMKILAQGQCKAVNAAVATVNTPWIMVSNDDHIYPPGWFNELVRNIEEDMLCVSPKLVEPQNGAPTFIKYFCGGAGGDFDKQKFLDYVKNYKYVDSTVYANPYWKTGFNLPFLIKKELWDLVGGYDINYDPWGSNGDSDLEYKIKLAGAQPYQNTNCLVYHFSQTSGTFGTENQRYWTKNFEYFIYKWGFVRTDDGIWTADFKIPEPPIRKFQPEWEGCYHEL
jgi:GT2 family glycosyltransferase